MKTAIVKTSFWEDEEFAKLNIDTRLLYCYLLTNPKRELVNVFKINRAVVAAHTGIALEQVKVCLNQLIKEGYVAHYQSWISIINDHVQAKSGRFTESAIERELSTIPEEVKANLSQFVSGSVPVHKDKDKDKDKDKVYDADFEKKEIRTSEIKFNPSTADIFEFVDENKNEVVIK